MAESPAHVLGALLLASECGLVDLAGDTPQSQLDIVPLFETGSDLEGAAATRCGCAIRTSIRCTYFRYR